MKYKFDFHTKMWYNDSITVADIPSVIARLRVCLPTWKGLKLCSVIYHENRKI